MSQTPTFSEVLEIRRINALSQGARVNSLCSYIPGNVNTYELISTVRGLGTIGYSSTGFNGFGVNTEPNQLIYIVQGANGQQVTAGSYYIFPGTTDANALVKNPTANFFSIPFAEKAIVFSANINYEGASFDTGAQLFVNIRNTTARNTQGTIIATATLSNGQFGPCNLQNFSSTYDPTVPNYLQVQVSTTNGVTIQGNHSNALYVSLCTF
jgi:hypothetical protein